MNVSKLGQILLDVVASGVPLMRSLERGAMIEWHPEKNPQTIEVRRVVRDTEKDTREAFKAEAAVFQREMGAVGINVMDDPQFYIVTPTGSHILRALWIVTSRTTQQEIFFT